MRLREILMERKRASNVSAQAEVQQPITDNHVEVADIPICVFAQPMSEFQALFADCEDF